MLFLKMFVVFKEKKNNLIIFKTKLTSCFENFYYHFVIFFDLVDF